MSTTEITRFHEFDAAHCLVSHASKCKYLHGHRYKAGITVTAPGLDELGMVLDFGCIKEKVGGWIDENWDHNIILNSRHVLAVWWSENYASIPIHGNQVVESLRGTVFANRAPYILKDANPTAEVLARELYNQTHRLLPAPITVIRIRLWETPKSFADYKP